MHRTKSFGRLVCVGVLRNYDAAALQKRAYTPGASTYLRTFPKLLCSEKIKNKNLKNIDTRRRTRTRAGTRRGILL